MFKQIYNREDGKPKLIESDVEGVFNFDKFNYTDIAPTSDLYEPMYFDGSEWIGSTREEWLDTLPEQEPDNPNSHDFLNAQLLANDLEHNSKIEDLQKDIANLTAELLKVQGGMNDVHNS